MSSPMSTTPVESPERAGEEDSSVNLLEVVRAGLEHGLRDTVEVSDEEQRQLLVALTTAIARTAALRGIDFAATAARSGETILPVDNTILELFPARQREDLGSDNLTVAEACDQLVNVTSPRARPWNCALKSRAPKPSHRTWSPAMSRTGPCPTYPYHLFQRMNPPRWTYPAVAVRRHMPPPPTAPLPPTPAATTAAFPTSVPGLIPRATFRPATGPAFDPAPAPAPAQAANNRAMTLGEARVFYSHVALTLDRMDESTDTQTAINIAFYDGAVPCACGLGPEGGDLCEMGYEPGATL
ncbi:hypothetical protein C8A01DRAFT_41879 [Parachaetomium inaequale]|uniref:Uncharacterized protein n=1 Tax=Parachaetomium inaequale TaxID=2588326 RepID=A0AAN6P6F9_9PEZI|nr:hypothetical protein C8A01DRAFT_41879 [Parachaetomium inaequale]